MKKVVVALSMLALAFSIQQAYAQDLEEILNQVAAASKANYKPEYRFDAYMQMEIIESGDKTILYDAFLMKDGGSYAVQFIMEGTRSLVLLDMENNAVLMLGEENGVKTGFAMGVDPEALAGFTGEVEENNQSYAEFRTGRTKSILGYSCDEYLIRQDGAEVRIWVSEKLGKELSKELLNNQQIFGGAFMYAAGINGMAMEYIFKDPDGDRMSMRITKLDMNASKSISTSDYAIMSMGQ